MTSITKCHKGLLYFAGWAVVSEVYFFVAMGLIFQNDENTFVPLSAMSTSIKMKITIEN